MLFIRVPRRNMSLPGGSGGSFIASSTSHSLSTGNQPLYNRVLFAAVIFVMMLLLIILFSSDGNTTEVKEKETNKNTGSDSYLFTFLFIFFLVMMIVTASRIMRIFNVFTSAVSSPTHDIQRSNDRDRLLRLLSIGHSNPLGVRGLQLALLDRDFNANDYEVLQQLDEGVRNTQGAADTEIARLPLHQLTEADIQRRKGDEAVCAICLEPFVVNEVTRTIPCLHSFHQKCIDTWLKSKASCPVCKFSAICDEREYV